MGITFAPSPFNLASLLALVACLLVWVFIWRTRWGYALRVVGQNPQAAVYAGISPERTIIVAMLISGGAGGLPGGQRADGIAAPHPPRFPGRRRVRRASRSPSWGATTRWASWRPSLLFGALYQGGSQLSFDMPHVNRDMVVLIQGLVILFCGALENVFRRAHFGRFSAPRRAPTAWMDAYREIILLLAATIRVATPLVLAALAGLFSERSGVIDLGLEGKMLGAAFAAAAVSAVTGSAWLGLGAGVATGDRSSPSSSPSPA